MASKTKKNNIAEEPKFEWLDEKYKCDECMFRRKGKCSKPISIACDCRKRFGIFILIANILAIGIIYLVFSKALYTSKSLMVSILLTAIAMCIMDFIFIGGRKLIRRVFSKIEKKRYQSYQQQVNNIEKMKQEKQKKEQVKSTDVNLAKQLIQKFYDMRKTENIKKNLNPFKTKKFREFLKILLEVDKILLAESFDYNEVKYFFKINLPEFFNICENYAQHYTEDNLTQKERESFDRLLESFILKSKEIQEILNGKKNLNLEVRMQALNSSMNPKGSE